MNQTTRRKFIAQGTMASLTALSSAPAVGQKVSARAIAAADRHGATDRPLIVSTWPFGKPSNERSLEIFKTGGSALDAVEKGINLAEEDLSNASVGAGGIPNSAGVVQLDACIMDGPTHKAGSVGALEGIVHAVSVDRRIQVATHQIAHIVAGAGIETFADALVDPLFQG